MTTYSPNLASVNDAEKLSSDVLQELYQISRAFEDLSSQIEELTAAPPAPTAPPTTPPPVSGPITGAVNVGTSSFGPFLRVNSAGELEFKGLVGRGFFKVTENTLNRNLEIDLQVGQGPFFLMQDQPVVGKPAYLGFDDLGTVDVGSLDDADLMLVQSGNTFKGVKQSHVGVGKRYDFFDLSTWVINHNLGREVNVRTYTTGGMEVLGEVLRNNTNQTTVYFDLNVTGFAVVV